MEKRELLKMLEYSALSYNDCQPRKSGEDVVFINDKKTGVQCYARTAGNTLSITFRGTESYRDLINDLKFWRKKIPYGNASSKIRVHSGFIDAYKCHEVRGKLHTLMTENIANVRVTGHSLGAAMAVLCAADLQYNFPLVDYETFLFGCPRVGNAAFKKSYTRRNFKTFRVENGNDYITKIPFAFMGYRHVGIRLHIGFPRIIGILTTDEHRLHSYYEKLWKA